MVLKEFSNPEEKDYDIKSSLNNDFFSSLSNEDKIDYAIQLTDLMGILKDVKEPELIENYGINIQEYFNPTALTIEKVTTKLNSNQNRKRR